MDKYELKVTISEIDSLISKRRFKEAAEIADSVDWRRVKNVRTLCRISDVYKVNRRYHDSKRVLELAYAKSPYGRQIIFSLCELELKLGNYVRALQLYNEYINVAPRDPDRYVLQYKLYKEQDVSVNERIAVLEELARHDMRDRWAFELARLYLEAPVRHNAERNFSSRTVESLEKNGFHGYNIICRWTRKCSSRTSYLCIQPSRSL